MEQLLNYLQRIANLIPYWFEKSQSICCVGAALSLLVVVLAIYLIFGDCKRELTLPTLWNEGRTENTKAKHHVQDQDPLISVYPVTNAIKCKTPGAVVPDHCNDLNADKLKNEGDTIPNLNETAPWRLFVHYQNVIYLRLLSGNNWYLRGLPKVTTSDILQLEAQLAENLNLKMDDMGLIVILGLPDTEHSFEELQSRIDILLKVVLECDVPYLYARRLGQCIQYGKWRAVRIVLRTKGDARKIQKKAKTNSRLPFLKFVIGSKRVL